MSILKQFFEEEMVPALGCTEPVAVALAVAKAREQIESIDPRAIDNIVKLSVILSNNVFKNGNQVGIPGTKGKTGNKFAAALALFCGDTSDNLEIFKKVDKNAVAKAESFLLSDLIELTNKDDAPGIYIEVKLSASGHTAQAVIEGTHSNFTKITLNGVVVLEKPNTNNLEAGESFLPYDITYDKLFDYLKYLDEPDYAFLQKAIEMNMEIAVYGLTHDVGIGLGYSVFTSYFPNNNLECFEKAPLSDQIKGYCAGASDARMYGISMPVMSSAGSGNHGIVTVIPVALYGKAHDFSKREIAEAMFVSQLSCSFIKMQLGRLSAICGCAVAAGAAAAAGIVFLETRDKELCAQAMLLVFANLAGMFCDGAKYSCSLKVGTGAEEAYRAAKLAISGKKILPQGIVDTTVCQTIQNMKTLNTDIMQNFDEFMVKTLKERN